MNKNWLSKELRLSINDRLFNKNEYNDREAFIIGWENKRYTIDMLAQSIKQGFAYCAELKGPRRAESFSASDILSVDVDEGMSLAEAAKNDIIKNYATLIYSTFSSTKESPKYRIVFALERTILDGRELKAAARSLALRLSGDPAAVDPSRIFYGNENCHFRTFDKGISEGFLNELIEQGRNVRTAGLEKDASKGGTGRSTLPFSSDLVLTTDLGKGQTINELSVKQVVYCPFHIDKNASAFVTQNKTGEKGIYCSRCATTFWQTDRSSKFDFFAFEAAAKAIQDHTNVPNDVDQFLDDVFSKTLMMNTNIVFKNNQFLGNVKFDEGATFIKSPKGTGKTEFLSQLVEKIDGSVLLVGHRRSLIKQMCNRLRLNCYLDDSENGSSVFDIQKRFGICLDSITKIPDDKMYDFIFIDESEQVLSHFLSDTLKDKRNAVYQRFKQLISTAKYVFALDADLGFVSFDFISEWVRRKHHDRISRIYINTFDRLKGKLDIYNSKSQLIGEIHRSIKQGLRCYVTSNSLKFVKDIDEVIRKDFPNAKVMTITSETVTSSGPIFEFLDNPSGEAINYDVILTSPSVSSGVDISFPDDEEIIDVVYGVFEALVLTHFECDQQLSRVRHPKRTKVYLSPRTFNFETNFDVVLHDALSLEMMDHLIEGYDHKGKKKYQEDDPFLQLAASIFSYQRASKNRLKQNFIQYKEAQGWEISFVEDDKAIQAEGSLKALEGKNLTTAKAINSLMEAPKITRKQFQELIEKKDSEHSLSAEENAVFVRGTIESFYRQEISENLINLDNRGKFRKAVQTFEKLTEKETSSSYDSILDLKFEENSDSLFLLSNDHHRHMYVAACLFKAGIYVEGKFLPEQIVVSDDLVAFVDFLESTRVKFEHIFNNTLRGDLRTKPMSQLSQMLSYVGLSMKKVLSRKKGSGKKYYYKINPEKYDVILEIVKNRKIRIEDNSPVLL